MHATAIRAKLILLLVPIKQSVHVHYEKINNNNNNNNNNNKKKQQTYKQKQICCL